MKAQLGCAYETTSVTDDTSQRKKWVAGLNRLILTAMSPHVVRASCCDFSFGILEICYTSMILRWGSQLCASLPRASCIFILQKLSELTCVDDWHVPQTSQNMRCREINPLRVGLIRNPRFSRKELSQLSPLPMFSLFVFLVRFLGIIGRWQPEVLWSSFPGNKFLSMVLCFEGWSLKSE